MQLEPLLASHRSCSRPCRPGREDGIAACSAGLVCRPARPSWARIRPELTPDPARAGRAHLRWGAQLQRSGGPGQREPSTRRRLHLGALAGPSAHRRATDMQPPIFIALDGGGHAAARGPAALTIASSSCCGISSLSARALHRARAPCLAPLGRRTCPAAFDHRRPRAPRLLHLSRSAPDLYPGPGHLGCSL